MIKILWPTFVILQSTKTTFPSHTLLPSLPDVIIIALAHLMVDHTKEKAVMTNLRIYF
jgi:hypothetical protein